MRQENKRVVNLNSAVSVIILKMENLKKLSDGNQSPHMWIIRVTL